MKPPMSYFGGKTILGPQIAALLPAHRHYVEPFCGPLWILAFSEAIVTDDDEPAASAVPDGGTR